MKNEVLFVLLNDYADYEPAYISGSINCDKFGMKQNPKYATKVVAPTMDLVRSCGGFHTMPDYSFDNMKRAIVYGSALASVTCEKFGTESLGDLTRDGLAERLKAFKKLMDFSINL